MDKIEEAANSLLAEFSDNSKSNKDAEQIMNRDPFIELKLELFSFFKERIGRISSQEKLRESIEESLQAQIDGGSLTFDQLLTLYNSVSKQNSISADSLISLFKPTPGVPSILAANLSEKENDKDIFSELYDQFSSDQLQKIEKLNKIFTVMLNEVKPENS